MGGGGVSFVRGSEAAWLNPAGLGGLKLAEFSAGYALIRRSFDDFPNVYWDTNEDGRIDATDAPLKISPEETPADGALVSLSSPIGSRVGIGFSAFMPNGRLIRIGGVESSLPDYFLYDRRLERFELAAGLGVDIAHGLRLGVGTQMLAAADVAMIASLDTTVSGASSDDTDVSQTVGGTTFDMHTLDLDVRPQLIPVAAVQWDLGRLSPALKGLSLGGTWRGAGGLPVKITVDLQVDATLTDMGDSDPLTFALVTPIALSFMDHYLPQKWTAGASYSYKKRILFSADVERTDWQDMIPAIVQVVSGTVESPLFQSDDPSVTDGNPYTLTLKATTGVRVGLEGVPIDQDINGKFQFVRLALRGGFGYSPSPLQSQGHGTAFLDADRIFFTGGVGLSHADPFGLVKGPISWELFFQDHILASGSLDLPAEAPYRAGGPVDGASIPIGGRLWTAGLQWSMEY